MKGISKFRYSCLVAVIIFITGCRSKSADSDDQDASPGNVQTPVTVVSPTTTSLTDFTELNATSSFLQDNIVKSTINGYIKSVNIKIGQTIAAGQILFTVKTKEAESLGNTIDKLDSSFHFSGITYIKANQAGYVTALDHQTGDYVQDGEQLAVISNSNSLRFVLNCPYELRKYLALNKKVDVVLPDSTKLEGIVSQVMPIIDSSSQTLPVLIVVLHAAGVPENLIAKVRIAKTVKPLAITLPKQAVLSNEAQSEFWIMKMTDSVTAVKTPVTKGMEVDNKIEILNPVLSPADQIVLTGNYGLPDTARVKIVKAE